MFCGFVDFVWNVDVGVVLEREDVVVFSRAYGEIDIFCCYCVCECGGECVGFVDGVVGKFD